MADAAALAEFFESNSYHDWHGLRVTDADPDDGRAVLVLPFRAELANDDGLLHGGATATLVDVACGAAIRSTFDRPDDVSMATTDLDVTYLRPATGDVRAVGRVERVGASMAAARTEVTSVAPGGERKTVATGSATYLRR
ncbi:MAG: PaaI family thioesterase [Haloarculaceae archaeon]